jgi:predicted  nucleic acid-binding Zn-ribbon protein
MPVIAEALSRLTAALDELDLAVARRLGAERSQADLLDELAMMREDRQKLTDMLDEALAHRRAMEGTVGQVNERIDRAIRTVRDVLDARPVVVAPPGEPPAPDAAP